jgi:tRNA (guanine37-N1)-methyltransferase
MRIDILTLFPDMFVPLNQSILKRAQDKGALSINVVDIRDFSTDPHKKCDDYPYGGGSGMVMTPQPLYDAIMSVKTPQSKVIYLSPKGKTLSTALAKSLSGEQHLVFVCGHYEGIDQRVIDLCVDMEISIGDYILTGGELACMVVVDALSRFVPGVLGNSNSSQDESFSADLLEYEHYTRPQEFMGLTVPSVLLSGNHQEIENYRKQRAKQITQERRPDLLKKSNEE